MSKSRYNASMKTKRYTKEEIPLLIAALDRGEIIAFPTDTVFGLACVCDNPQAIQKVKAAKNRDAEKPLPMMCANIAMVKHYAEVNEAAERLMKAFFPGALTLIFNKQRDVPAYVTNGKDSIGIRIPNTPFIVDMIQQLQRPLLVTSANLSGEPSLRNWCDVEASLRGRIDGILCEDAKSETASTIVDIRTDYRILRQGEISAEAIAKVLR